MRCGANERLSRREFLKLIGGAAACGVVLRPKLSLAATEAWHRRMEPLMGTFVEVAVLHDDRETALKLIGDTFDFISRRIAEISSWDPDSQISRLREQKLIARSVLLPAVERLVRAAAWAEAATQKRFRLNCGALTDLWRAAREAGSIPDSIDLRHALRGVERSGVSHSSGALEQIGSSRTDVGGIGKGLVADLAAEYLNFRGVNRARVACSGDLRFVGAGPWTVEIEDPRSERMLREVQLEGSLGIATSGDYRNCWVVNGERYHHLIDPQTGRPGDFNQQVTVIAPSAVQADALASGLFFVPAERGLQLLKALRGVDGIIVDAAHRQWSTAA